MENINLISCGLFKDSISSADYKTMNDGIINNKLERIQKEAALVSFKVLSQYFP
jgi:hypothetical protein